ncbi:MAG: c-type cytochrome [Pseudomonadota bacterium]|nr:c-type cytochrome [Pseudomonadota bacterium]
MSHALHRPIRRLPSLLTLAAALVLTACSPSPPPAPTAADQARAEQLRPANAQLSEKYERSCMVCHTQLAANAPLTGFGPAWQPVLKQGMDTLLLHAEQGIRSMPPRGQCADCSAEELRSLIEFMAQDASQP